LISRQTLISDVVETATSLKLRDRDLQKFQDRGFKICGFCRKFSKKCHHFQVEFVSNFWHFSELFWLFFTC